MHNDLSDTVEFSDDHEILFGVTNSPRTDKRLSRRRKPKRRMNTGELSFYFHAIQQNPTFTPKQERRIFAKYARLKRDRKKKALLNTIVLHNLGLVIWVAKSYLNRGLELPDLIQEGTFGLMDAIEKFDLSRGVKFSTHAQWWIRARIGRSIENSGRVVRLPSHVQVDMGKLMRFEKQFQTQHGRKPTKEEATAALSMKEEKYEDLSRTRRMYLRSLSLEEELMPGKHGPESDDVDFTVSSQISDLSRVTPEVYCEAHRELALASEEVERIKTELLEKYSGNSGAQKCEIFLAYFGLSPGSGPQTLEMLGAKLGVTRERIRQIVREGMVLLGTDRYEMERLGRKLAGLPEIVVM